jgi:hypothetical protein
MPDSFTFGCPAPRLGLTLPRLEASAMCSNGKEGATLRVMHDNPIGSHFSASKTHALMAANFYFPKMATRIGASMVSAMPDAQDFEKDYQTCPDFAKIFIALKDGKQDTEHPQYPEYYINPEGLLIFEDNQIARAVMLANGTRPIL